MSQEVEELAYYRDRNAKADEIAHESDFELLDALWTLKSGRTVELRVVETEEDHIHPFKKYQKKRGGHVGTIFQTLFTKKDTGEIIYDGEMMLAGWGDGSDKGQWVKFWLDEERDLHPFAGFTGRHGREQIGDIFHGTFAELDDSSQPVDQKQEKKVTKRKQTLSQFAYLLAHENEHFLQFLREKAPPLANGKEWTPDIAHMFIKHVCGKIDSLGDLDRIDTAAETFHKAIRKPYARFCGE